MLKNPSVTTRVRLAVAFPAAALALVVLALFPIVQNLRIGGPTYNGVRQLQQLQVDGSPSALVLSDMTLLANQAYLTQFVGADPAATPAPTKDTLLASLTQAKTRFSEKRLLWTKTMAANKSLAPLVTEVIGTGSALITAVDSELVPNLTPATAAQARNAIAKVNELSRTHDRSISSLTNAVNNELKTKEDTAKNSAWQRLIGLLGLAFLALAGAIIGSRGVMSSLLEPVEALTEQANRAAHQEIPALVAAINTMEPGTELMQATPFPVAGNDEFSQLAKALNVMQDTAVSMAVDQARNRRGVSESLINLGRRNQGLLARTLTFIAELEQNERNPETLTHLFRLDHLTTRMRRNAESLLVLAGSEPPRVWTESVPISDIIRASLSEIESYGRVDLAGLDPAKVKGTSVSDLAHLLAELMENATNFSPPSSRVVVIGSNISEGYLLSIRDNGIGMTQDEIDEANRRLSDAAMGDVTPSKVLGHYVVSKLAARHGIRVGLSQTIGSSGVTAEVLVPRTIAETNIGTGNGGAGFAPHQPQQPQPVQQQSPLPSSAPVAPSQTMPAQPAMPMQPAPQTNVPAPAPVQAAAPVEPERTADGLRKRVRGAQVPNRDVVPDAEQQAFDSREAELRARSIRTQAEARGHASPPVAPVMPPVQAPTLAPLPPFQPAPVAAPAPMAPAPAPAPVAAPAPMAPAALAPLPTRNRGASWVDEPTSLAGEQDFRDPTEVRNALSGFQSAPMVPDIAPGTPEHVAAPAPFAAPAGWVEHAAAGASVPPMPLAPPGMAKRQRGASWVEPDMAPATFETPSDPSFVRSSLSSFQNMPHPHIDYSDTPTETPKEI
jgi:signal transduction histidine kinase